MSTTGPAGRAATVSATCAIMRDVVSVEKSGRLRSGQCSVMPQAASRSRNSAAFEEAGDDANPWR